MTRRRIRLLGVIAMAGVAGWLALATPAAAHNVLRSTSPADGASVGPVPAEVVLTFDEPALAMGTALMITGPSGPVQSGAARLLDTTVAQSIGPGAPAGTYRVDWRVTSADGHPISGSFTFTAHQPGGGSAPASPASASGGLPSSGTSSSASRQPNAGRAVPAWLWPVVAAMLLASALGSAAITRRRRRQ